jgi:DNA repair exonuclease SbcCD nuclease subunit
LRGIIDTIVVSGDLSDDGEKRNLECALDFLEAPPSFPSTNMTADQWPTLHHAQNNLSTFFVTPGNHDRFRGSIRLPGGTEFDDVFKKYWRKGLGGVQSLTLTKSGSKLALVTADFCLQETFRNAFRLWGRGMAYDKTIDDLRAETLVCQAENAAVVWIIHFPPLPDAERGLRLINPTLVLEAAQEHKIPYIIAGHLHRNQTNTHGQTEIICTGSAASDFRAWYGNYVRLFEFDVSGEGGLTLNQKVFRYVPEQAEFFPV